VRLNLSKCWSLVLAAILLLPGAPSLRAAEGAAAEIRAALAQWTEQDGSTAKSIEPGMDIFQKQADARGRSSATWLMSARPWQRPP
jgi:hypothetical protein